jgi:hypothetical protein
VIDLVGEYHAVMRRMPFAEAVRLHDDFGVPWRSITTACPVPAQAVFADRERLLYEPAENGRAVWIMPVCAVDPSQPEEIETVDPMDVVADLSRVVDLVAFDPHCRERFALRTGGATVLGAVEPQLLGPDRVRVWNDIGDWLRDSCRGIVLLTNDCHQRGRILRRLSSIEAQQPTQVTAWLGLPAYPPGLPPAVFPMRAA